MLTGAIEAANLLSSHPSAGYLVVVGVSRSVVLATLRQEVDHIPLILSRAVHSCGSNFNTESQGKWRLYLEDKVEIASRWTRVVAPWPLDADFAELGKCLIL